jgi:polyphenol oxidase
MFDVITPNWPAPAKVKAFTTTRKNSAVLRNHLPSEPCWLKQVHGVHVVEAKISDAKIIADAAFTRQTNIVCAVLTADCLPIFLCDRNATIVAAIHAGWKGLAAGIIEQTVKALNIPAENLLAWLGPAIGPTKFEVRADVLEKFITVDPQAEQAFKPFTSDSWLADIYLLAKQRLQQCNVTAIYGGGLCTYSDEQRFFSYRRDNQQTGRMASLIWLI